MDLYAFFTFPIAAAYLKNFLVENAQAVITDSGGITEETTILGVPFLTLRSSTERPETVTIGTNELLGCNHEKIKAALNNVLTGNVSLAPNLTIIK